MINSNEMFSFLVAELHTIFLEFHASGGTMLVSFVRLDDFLNIDKNVMIICEG